MHALLRGLSRLIYIAREDDAADHFYAVRSGKVAIEVFAPGRGAAVLETLDAGAIVGWSWLFPPYRWAFDVRAVELTRAIAFDGACLRGKCERDPALGYDFMKRFARIMMQRFRTTRLQLLDVYGDARR
jgi:CRP-like cAMP-binding protein